MLEKKVRYRNYVDIFDGGPDAGIDIDRVRAIRKSRAVKGFRANPRRASGQPAGLRNHRNTPTSAPLLVRTNRITSVWY